MLLEMNFAAGLTEFSLISSVDLHLLQKTAFLLLLTSLANPNMRHDQQRHQGECLVGGAKVIDAALCTNVGFCPEIATLLSCGAHQKRLILYVILGIVVARVL